MGRDADAREEVAQLGRLAIAAAKDEPEAPVLRAAAPLLPAAVAVAISTTVSDTRARASQM